MSKILGSTQYLFPARRFKWNLILFICVQYSQEMKLSQPTNTVLWKVIPWYSLWICPRQAKQYSLKVGSRKRFPVVHFGTGRKFNLSYWTHTHETQLGTKKCNCMCDSCSLHVEKRMIKDATLELLSASKKYKLPLQVVYVSIKQLTTKNRNRCEKQL